MSGYYNQRYQRKQRWLPLDQYIAKKEAQKAYRASISGHGAYRTKSYSNKPRAPRRKSAPRPQSWVQKAASYAPAIGSAVGNYIAPGIGGAIGSAAGGLIASIAGHGAYTVKRNTIAFPDQVPLFTTKEDGCIRMVHREFITDIVTSSVAGAFQIQTYPIDVANPTTFPYLSQIASNFEEWHMEGLIFEYKTTSGSISATGQLGTAVLATQYNSNALPFQNKQSMEAYTFASSTVVSASVIHPVECDPAQTPSNGLFYTNVPGTSPAGTAEDKRWSQLGNFSIATQGCAVSENIGELWVSYDCIMCKPRMISNTSALADHWVMGAGITTGGPYFGTDPALTDNSDDFTALGGAVILFKSSFNGRVAIAYSVVGAAGLWTDPLFTAGVGATPVLLLRLGANQYTSDYLATETQCDIVAYFDIESQPSGAGLPVGYGASITVSLGTFFTPTGGDLIITQLPSDFQ